MADCYFITTNYQQAVSYYDKVIANGKTDADYALFQKGFCLGLTNNQTGKAEILTFACLKISLIILCPECYL